ncbi:uncharacterized protein LOC119188454 [Manduca sexta]|uniref:uncharacterized protein LOC119188454 n=1 Tax=Manduca sexta TaxID=7130 RepID=UPI00188F3955|nr:uncharacterized protein LOC119188454 [Manduca sexta]
MTQTQKYRSVNLPVPECMEIIYVQVEVENDFTTPEVKYNWTTTTVAINYKKSQKSTSYYDIVARAIKDKDCGGSTHKELRFKNKFLTTYTN